LKILLGTPDDPRVTKSMARYNGAPSQDLLVIRRHPKTGAYRLDLLRWGLIPNWTTEASPRVKPINATAERVATAPMFREADGPGYSYPSRRNTRAIAVDDNTGERAAAKRVMQLRARHPLVGPEAREVVL
jgi:hypothetical protein